ncbi:FAD-binding domain-containing protein [Daedalea quercina L-15889]|uniref:FAD-binding domain-containing protein n=1 Tax=Daedalea quercina L-15889 TaxID=1314783 RepID=A0A165SGA6_9APHY|nr:FAD-binding domain-containing protein [Daedalea quercina L-15889]
MLRPLLRATYVALLLHRTRTAAQDAASTCQQIASAISDASAVFYNPDPSYLADIAHYATSSTDESVCSVEPGTAEDVGTILSILDSSQTPFGVKGGGHASNPNFSSSTGVQISMYRLNRIDYDSSTGTVAVGAGNVWDNVYSALEPYGVNVVGGRVSGIGVAGFTLGGGYSWLTNQYGLALDSVRGFELVLPNGTVTDVTESAYPDLFWGLKGGYNNYGIVTTFTLQAYPQGQVWGGQLIILGEYIDQVNVATANFAANVTDPKAQIIATYDYEEGALLAAVMLFYDAPSQPAGIFDEFLAIPALSANISTRSFLSLVQVEPTTTSESMRGFSNTVPFEEITLPLLETIVAQLEYWGAALSNSSAALLSYDVEPFLPSILTHGGPSAYPWTRDQRFLPFNMGFFWTDAQYDGDFYEAIVESSRNLTDTAVQEGQTQVPSAPLYPNYALFGTPVGSMYGESLAEMTMLKQTYDPQNVMGLTGGWKVTG